MPDSPITARSLVHPHQIEVQDFASYALVIDARSAAEYAQDHIPGAVHLPADLAGPAVPKAATAGRIEERDPAMPYALAAATAQLRSGDTVLVYCSRGGLDSLHWAEPLRRAGWTVDVLGGGWPNYRNWVQSGLEVLPRALSLRCLLAPPIGGIDRVLPVLQELEQQVIDLTAAAGQDLAPGLTLPNDLSPGQLAFETRLLDVLRQVDPERLVWLAVPVSLGARRWPPALSDRLARGRALRIAAPARERASAWLEARPASRVSLTLLLDQLGRLDAPPAKALIEHCSKLLAAGKPVDALTELVEQYLDPAFAGLGPAAFVDTIELPSLDVAVVQAALADLIARHGDQIRP